MCSNCTELFLNFSEQFQFFINCSEQFSFSVNCSDHFAFFQNKVCIFLNSEQSDAFQNSASFLLIVLKYNGIMFI